MAEIGSEMSCIICGQSKLNGIVIISEFICESCEAEMVHTDVHDEKYPYFIQQMRQVWYRKDA